MINKIPKPDTLVAKLTSAGYTQPRFTRHTFVEAREVALPRGADPRAWEYIYRCEETGEERRWGLVRRQVDVPAPATEVN